MNRLWRGARALADYLGLCGVLFMAVLGVGAGIVSWSIAPVLAVVVLPAGCLVALYGAGWLVECEDAADRSELQADYDPLADLRQARAREVSSERSRMLHRSREHDARWAQALGTYREGQEL